ncbi:DNA-binding protein [Bisgaard Taxon 45]
MKTNTSLQPLPYPQTPESANAYFIKHGINKSEWARQMKVPRTTVADLLRGKMKGNWGNSHRTAILLGLKENPQQELCNEKTTH